MTPSPMDEGFESSQFPLHTGNQEMKNGGFWDLPWPEEDEDDDEPVNFLFLGNTFDSLFFLGIFFLYLLMNSKTSELYDLVL